jgi:RNA polymerase sigma-32 factor
MSRRQSSSPRQRADGSVRAYVRQVGRTPPLTRAEEDRLVREYARTRDPAVGRRLAEANLRLVIRMAGRYARRSPAALQELVQQGTVGLMEAVARYDPGRGVRFATYATWWIRALILEHVMHNARLVRVGRSRADRRAFFNGIPLHGEVSLDAPPKMGDVRPLVDTMHADEVPVDQALEDAELALLVQRQARVFGDALPEREAAVFQQRVLADDEARPLRELADRFEVSPERIRQIEHQLRGQLRSTVGAALAA